jgi:hypothetical protein
LHGLAVRQRFNCKPREGANSTPRKQIDHDDKIQEAFVDADVGDVARHCSRINREQGLAPELVWGIDIELPVQSFVNNDRRAASISTGLLFVTNLGPDPC